MSRARISIAVTVLVAGLGAFLYGCREHMPHAVTWPATGVIQQTHPKPPEGGYYQNWDPYAAEVKVDDIELTDYAQAQHLLVATVVDAEGKPLPNRRVEWMLSRGGVGEIVEVDESGWRSSRGYKVDNEYAVSHTGNFKHTLTKGTEDASDDVVIGQGQTWCVITSPVEGDTHITVYAPAIYDWNKHKVFLTRHWYDVGWVFPEDATNPVGTTHRLTTLVMKHSDGSPLAGYDVTYAIVDGPEAVFDGSDEQSVTVQTDAGGTASVTLKQVTPAAGTNTVNIDILRPGDEQCCKPAVHIASGQMQKLWVAPEIAITKHAPAQVALNATFQYSISVSNPSRAPATSVVVTDILPRGIEYVSSAPAATVDGRKLAWSLGTLASNTTTDINVKVKAKETGTFENCADVAAGGGLAGRDCATTHVANAKLELEKTCPSEALLCDNISFQVVVRNTGDGTATNVMISDELPEGLRTVDGKRKVTFNGGTLAPGEEKQATYEAKADKPGTYTNHATVTADGGLSASTTCTTTVRAPVLEVTKSAPQMRYVGRPIKYEITVRNTGDAAAEDTVLVDHLPARAKFDSASGNPERRSGTLTWRLGTLAPNASKTVEVALVSNETGVLKNDVEATAYCAEASASSTTEVKGIPAILLEVVDVEDPIEVGSEVHYVITVTNQGSAVGTNIKIVCDLPQQQEYVASDGPSKATVAKKTVTFTPLASLAPKAIAIYRITTKATAAADSRFKVVMTSDQISSPVQETEATNLY